MSIKIAGGLRTPRIFAGTRCWADGCHMRAQGWGYDNPYCREHLDGSVPCPVCDVEFVRGRLRSHLLLVHRDEVAA